MNVLKLPLKFLFFFIWIGQNLAQTVEVQAYVYEALNRGLVKQAQISITDKVDNKLAYSLTTDDLGFFKFSGEEGKVYTISIEKQDLDKTVLELLVKNETDGKQFLKIEMKRSPGYIFDVTLAEKRETGAKQSNGIQDAQIEIYNRTISKEEWVEKSYPSTNFQFTLKPGNHYTILIRKQGFLGKRIEAYVNVKGCVLCIDGVSEMTPGVADNISQSGLGTILANIEMEKVAVGKSFEIKNINYDYNKWDIRSDAATILDNVVHVFTDNPELELELGSHTDARGNDEYNLDLSNKRAFSARNYLLQHGVDSQRISYKGYGETVIKNRCKNGITCSDVEHEVNRRTELKIIGIKSFNAEEWKPLSRMITEEEFEQEMFKSLPSGKSNSNQSKSQSPKPVQTKNLPEKKSGKKPGPNLSQEDNDVEEVENEESQDNLSTLIHSDLSSQRIDTGIHYFVIAGSFLIPSHAEKQINKLIKMGYKNAVRMIIGESEYHSVVVEDFENENQAKKLVQKLKSKKIDAFVKKVQL
ncbi:MAG TPA: OmpA family protein [Saprospiraceae bacterium]|nr:OmpA family protein [Saprospiraceae bacterium]